MFVTKVVPFVIKYFKALFENSSDFALTRAGYDLLRKIIDQFSGLARAVNLTEMEQIAKISTKNADTENNNSPKQKAIEKHDEHRIELQRKVRMKKFKDDVRKYGLMETVTMRFRAYAMICKHNRQTRKLLESRGSFGLSRHRLRHHERCHRRVHHPQRQRLLSAAEQQCQAQRILHRRVRQVLGSPRLLHHEPIPAKPLTQDSRALRAHGQRPREKDKPADLRATRHPRPHAVQDPEHHRDEQIAEAHLSGLRKHRRQPRHAGRDRNSALSSPSDSRSTTTSERTSRCTS